MAQSMMRKLACDDDGEAFDLWRSEIRRGWRREVAMDTNAAWSLEQRFWLEGSSVYDELLDPACLMVFPGMGVLRSAQVLASVKDAPRWALVEMSKREIGRPNDAVIVLGYLAVAQREGAKPYRCFCTSTYRRAESAWKLVQHQQTVAD
jgi:hypothetical protein